MLVGLLAADRKAGSVYGSSTALSVAILLRAPDLQAQRWGSSTLSFHRRPSKLSPSRLISDLLQHAAVLESQRQSEVFLLRPFGPLLWPLAKPLLDLPLPTEIPLLDLPTGVRSQSFISAVRCLLQAFRLGLSSGSSSPSVDPDPNLLTWL